MKPKKLMRELKKRRPKTYAKVLRQWDVKMFDDVQAFVFNIMNHVTPRLSDRQTINGPRMEEELWRLLEKVRRITQNERRN